MTRQEVICIILIIALVLFFGYIMFQIGRATSPMNITIYFPPDTRSVTFHGGIL